MTASRTIALATALASAAALAACSGGNGAGVDAAIASCPLGDPTAPAMLEIVHLDASSNVVVSQPDAIVPLLFPPQGGWIVLLGARATNLDGCRLTLTTSFRDVGSASIYSVDKRPTLLDATGDGWGVTSVNRFGNLPVCPQASVTRNLHDQPYEFTVELDDANGQHASQTITMSPVCPSPDPTGLCLCQCDKNYVLGSCPPVAAPADGFRPPGRS